MADKKEITDIVLYEGTLDELHACLAQLGDKRRYEFAGVEYYGPETGSLPDYYVSRQRIREHLEKNGFDGVVNKRIITIVPYQAVREHYKIHGTPIRLVKDSTIPVVDPTFGS